jgi:ADP-ribosylglycohydrolase
MRVLPLALWHSGGAAELAADAAQQSRVTHGHPRTQVGCAISCLWRGERLKDRVTLRTHGKRRWRWRGAYTQKELASALSWSAAFWQLVRRIGLAVDAS